MRLVQQRVDKIAGMNIPVLIQGQAGTGKEVLASWIHKRSPWSSGPYVRVNCAAIPGTLLESELFGYDKGAFTGANTDKPGRVELAHEGTLFLDEIAEIDLGLQAKLLHFLQDGRFCRIGGREERHIGARVICATNRILEREIDSGNFRPDLFYRINVVQIQMPPLRDRREDIPVLAEYFLNICNTRFERKAPSLSPEMNKYLQNLDWPGNIRELENRVARYVLLGSEEAFESGLTEKSRLPGLNRQIGGESLPLKRITKEAIRNMERSVILRVLRENHWNRRKTAQVLNISYRALIYKIRETGLAQKGSKKDPSSMGKEEPGIQSDRD
jgi:two-component system, NtrC family, response regulator AtoC